MDISISQEMIRAIGISAIISWVLVEIIKPFIKGQLDKEKAKSLLRLGSVISGGAVGYSLLKTWEGLWVGASSGAFNTAIVALVKSRLKTLRGSGVSNKDTDSVGED